MDFSSVGTTSTTLRRILIVADNSLIVEAIRIGFRKSGEFNLIGHVNARSTSVQVMLEAQPDVVLIDDMDGSERALELVGELSEQNEHVSVMVLAVRLEGDRIGRLLDAGATTVISKASPPGAVAMLVRETLHGHIVHKLELSAEHRTPASAGTAPTDAPLTGRELEILQLLAGGCTNADIARRLWVTEQTVKFHLRNIYRKLKVANRTQASHFAYVNGLVDVQSRPSAERTPQLSAIVT